MSEEERRRRERVVKSAYAMTDAMMDTLRDEEGQISLGDIHDVLGILLATYADMLERKALEVWDSD